MVISDCSPILPSTTPPDQEYGDFFARRLLGIEKQRFPVSGPGIFYPAVDEYGCIKRFFAKQTGTGCVKRQFNIDLTGFAGVIPAERTDDTPPQRNAIQGKFCRQSQGIGLYSGGSGRDVQLLLQGDLADITIKSDSIVLIGRKVFFRIASKVSGQECRRQKRIIFGSFDQTQYMFAAGKIKGV